MATLYAVIRCYKDEMEVYPDLKSAGNRAEVYIKNRYLEDNQEVEIWEISKRFEFDYPPTTSKIWQERKED